MYYINSKSIIYLRQTFEQKPIYIPENEMNVGLLVPLNFISPNHKKIVHSSMRYQFNIRHPPLESPTTYSIHEHSRSIVDIRQYSSQNTTLIRFYNQRGFESGVPERECSLHADDLFLL
jgi:hypothetical protein